MIGGVDVFGGSERTTVEVGFGGATGAKDVVSATIVQRRRLRIVFAVQLCNVQQSLLLLLSLRSAKLISFAQDCKAAVRIDRARLGYGCLVDLWLAALVPKIALSQIASGPVRH